jgi:lipoyl(octanoyl) transferase
MDLGPFRGINPCGYAGLEVTQLADVVADVKLDSVKQQLQQQLVSALGYQQVIEHGDM